MQTTCDLTYCALCAGAIVDRVRAARRLFGPVRKARDPEAVHDLRVASRRLRAAITLLSPCLPRRTKAWRKEVRRITRALGRARDLDVQIGFVEAFAAHARAPSWRPGLERLLKRLSRRRQAAQKRVLKALKRIEDSGILRGMEQELAKRARGAWRKGPAAREAYRQVEKTLVPLLESLLAYAPDLQRPEAADRHHQMRIAAKRLRYSLEVFEGLYGQAIAPALNAARQMQTLLGDLHDCDVWISLLPNFLAAQRERTAEDSKDIESVERLAPGIEALRRNRMQARVQLYRRCLSSWQKSRKKTTWSSLQEVLRQATVGASHTGHG